jgi:deoxyribose-phosphate aldolase
MTLPGSDFNLADYIEHSALNPTITPEQIAQYCTEAEQFNFPVICVYPSAVKDVREILQGKKIKICTVIGFPTGANTAATKLFEAQEAVENGATELDVMINLGLLKMGNSEAIYQEIARICEETGQTVKAILETNVLTNTEKRLAAEICMDAGVSYLKTSTGWFGGATVEDVKMLHNITKGRVGIKASGGIKNLEQAFDLIEAGAIRLGTSKGINLMQQLKTMNNNQQ